MDTLEWDILMIKGVVFRNYEKVLELDCDMRDLNKQLENNIPRLVINKEEAYKSIEEDQPTR
jgi:hypothetical protein